MLQHLQIKNLVIVRSLALDFDPQMSAFTGETGAGKSVLIGALGLALGEKADKEMIRNGCDSAEIAASFELDEGEPARKWLHEHDLAGDEACILRRVLVRSGRSRAYVNSVPVPLQQLRELGELLIDIHGQHEHQSLIRAASQRRLLDAYAGHLELLESVATVFMEFDQAQKHLQQMQSKVEDRSQRLDYLNFQISELTQLGPDTLELEQLVKEQRQLAHAEQLASDTAALNNLLFESDTGVQTTLSRACDNIKDLAKLDPSLDEMDELLENARIYVDESAGLLRDYQQQINIDPDRLAIVDQRLSQIQDLARKHNLQPEMLPEKLADLQAEQEQLTSADATLADLAQDVETLRKRFIQLAQQLSHSRHEAAERLSREISDSMQHLGMKGGSFKIDCEQLADTIGSRHGLDNVNFKVSANPGQPLAPLAKVASGGELSRISLAIQVATAGYGEVPTLIFDEVDSGIGGAVAEIVGRLLRKLGKQRQIFCVTHLPQVAAQAHQQLLVKKTSDGNTTETTITSLDSGLREKEVARMLGGMKITDQTLNHAKEMIEHAQQG